MKPATQSLTLIGRIVDERTIDVGRIISGGSVVGGALAAGVVTLEPGQMVKLTIEPLGTDRPPDMKPCFELEPLAQNPDLRRLKPPSDEEVKRGAEEWRQLL